MSATAKQRVARTLRVLHETRYDHDRPVELAHHVAYLRPRDTEVQRVRDWSLHISPWPDGVDAQAAARLDHELEDAAQGLLPPVDAALREALDPAPGVQLSVDPWGNWRAVFSHSRVHRRLIVRASFLAELKSQPGLRPHASPAWESVAQRLRYQPGQAFDEALEFMLPSWFAPRDAALARLASEVFLPGTPLLSGALALMHLVHRRFEYRPAATSVATRATDALAQRRGVCQDFAHVMIGAMRSIGLAARYVSGYLLTQPPPGQPRLVGADASHAWVAVWCPVHGWVALDPTNAVTAGPDHVTLAWGRDYGDVAPLRGVIRGGDGAEPRVSVTVEPVDPVDPVQPDAAGDGRDDGDKGDKADKGGSNPAPPRLSASSARGAG
ncbi:transglutaminase family protein [Sphaerotilus mobilis]|uniref:Transglutaminase-like putative cysteine protease n=1 Tax=Sphaerotilus mobilis TaxID=47994 RepID=A0A4Q7LUS7_9BURK|nr:transglutaminase family protein [Sphaerotilus mobilis]RZS58002.1 transglutaminase-like putative cysteine protease [Sphaerotilus mobilis]